MKSITIKGILAVSTLLCMGGAAYGVGAGLVQYAQTRADYAATFVSADPADGATVTSLHHISTYWNGTDEETGGNLSAVLKDAAGNVVTKGDMNYDWDDPTLFTCDLYEEVTADGTYTLEIPGGALVDANGDPINEPVTLHYTIGTGTTPGGGDEPGQNEEDNVVYEFETTQVIPAAGSTVDMNENNGASGLDLINLKFSSEPYLKDGYDFIFTDDKGNEYATTMQMTFGYGENTVILGLPEDIESGVYTLTVPKGVIGNRKWANSNYTEGKANPEMTFSWTYVAKEAQGELPEWVLNDPLELEMLTLTTEEGIVYDLLDENTALESIPANSVFSIVTNKNEYAGSLYLQIVDNKKDEIIYTIGTLVNSEVSIGAKDENGVFKFEKATLTKLYNDRDYTFLIEAFLNYEVPESERISFQQTSVTLHGLTPPYVYSPVDIVRITPDPDRYSFEYLDERSFSIEYDAPVNIITSGTTRTVINMGAFGGSPVNFEKIESNEDKTEWTFTMPESILAGAGGVIITNIVAEDLEGRRVYPDYCEYNSGEEDKAMQMIVFECFLGCAEIEVVPGEGLVDKLYEFEFTCPTAYDGAIGFSGMGSHDVAEGVLYNEDGEEVARLDRRDYTEITNGAATDETVIKLIMHLDKEIDSEGVYELYLMPGLFMTGRESMSLTNRPYHLSYTVKQTSVESVAGSQVMISAANGKLTITGLTGNVEVFAANGAKVVSEKAVAGQFVTSLAKGIYIVKADGKSYKVSL